MRFLVIIVFILVNTTILLGIQPGAGAKSPTIVSTDLDAIIDTLPQKFQGSQKPIRDNRSRKEMVDTYCQPYNPLHHPTIIEILQKNPS